MTAERDTKEILTNISLTQQLLVRVLKTKIAAEVTSLLQRDHIAAPVSSCFLSKLITPHTLHVLYYLLKQVITKYWGCST